MPLLQPSFRGRLRLFFAVIVIVPMIAVGIVLFQLLDAGDNFKLDTRLTQAQTTAKNLYRQRRTEALAALKEVQSDVGLSPAIRNRDVGEAERRLAGLARQAGLEEVQIEVKGLRPLHAGSNAAI